MLFIVYLIPGTEKLAYI